MIIFHSFFFRKKTVPERHDFVKTNHLCFNCLGKGHGINQCNNKKSCFTCHQRHHTLLHVDAQQSVNNSSYDQSKETTPPTPAPPDTNTNNPSAVTASSSTTNFTSHSASSRIGSTILLSGVTRGGPEGAWPPQYDLGPPRIIIKYNFFYNSAVD